MRTLPSGTSASTASRLCICVTRLSTGGPRAGYAYQRLPHGPIITVWYAYASADAARLLLAVELRGLYGTKAQISWSDF